MGNKVQCNCKIKYMDNQSWPSVDTSTSEEMKSLETLKGNIDLVEDDFLGIDPRKEFSGNEKLLSVSK
jgi:hypothetical protein